MVGTPTGTITFLFTDIEGSTRLWEEQPDAMTDALVRHDRILRDAIDDHDEDHWLNHWLWAAARVQPELSAAVHIMGAQAALAKRTGFVFGIPIRRDVDRLFERARAELDPESFDVAWAEGQAASVDQAGALALEGLDQPDQ